MHIRGLRSIGGANRVDLQIVSPCLVPRKPVSRRLYRLVYLALVDEMDRMQSLHPL